MISIIKRSICIGLVGILLVGCGAKGQVTENKIEVVEETKAGEVKSLGELEVELKTSSLSDIKETLGITAKSMLSETMSPMYNVDRNAKFTFHFKSTVDPFQAVTVHTDENCGVNSMLYTMNQAYFVGGGGLDVIVNRFYTPTLNVKDRLDYNEKDNSWGHAQKYYLSINYDLNSEEVMKLDKPIIIPFTLKSELDTPVLSYKVSDKGVMSLRWTEVDGATGYRVYSAYKSTEEQGDYTEKEHGYIGLNLKLVEELSVGDLTSGAIGTKSEYSYELEDLSNSIDSKYKNTQNMVMSDVYFVTAVSGNKESDFSAELNTFKYRGQLPREVDLLNSFGSVTGEITELPEVVTVKMVDGSTSKMPVDFRLIDDTYAKTSNIVTYEYEVVGTLLTGKIDVTLLDGKYVKEKKSTASVDTLLYECRLDLSELQSKSMSPIAGVDGSEVDLTTVKDYNENSRVVFDKESLDKRLDLEMARIVTNGVYNTDPFTISVVDYEHKQNNLEEREKQLGDIFTLATTEEVSEGTTEEATEGTTEGTTEEATEGTTEEATEGTTEEATEGTAETNSLINSDNIVNRKLKELEDKIEIQNSLEVTVPSGYYVKADTVEEAYLAYSLINQDEKIYIDMFPSLLSVDSLMDVYEKVYYQNPYFLGAKSITLLQDELGKVWIESDYKYDKETAKQMQAEIYSKAKQVVSDNIKGNMSDEDKVKAIWDYLESNSKYDKKALESAEKNDFTTVEDDFNYAFNTYGILVKGLGVCQSYAYTVDLLMNMGGVECMTLTGYLNKTLPHAWNAVKLGEQMYWMDATQNYDIMGLSYYLYNTSSEYAEDNNYVLDEKYELDNNLVYIHNKDMSKDWYVENGLVVNSDAELVDAITSGWDITDKVSYGIRLHYEVEPSKELVNTIVQSLAASGKKETDLANFNLYDLENYLIVVKDDKLFKEQMGIK